jgi:chromatin segregation and condensation protein Rec8/ScpA/Scc1 (kleisin family)
VFSPDAKTTVPFLSEALKALLYNLPKAAVLTKAIVSKVISLEEMIGNLTERIKTSLKLSFKEFAHVGKKEKVNIIVSFLAMLELVKQGIISVRQDKHFDEILMETEHLDVPRYT